MDIRMESHGNKSRTVPIESVTINWTNQSLHIMNQLHNLLDSGEIYKKDITIICAGASVECHKFILCLCSGFFADVFKDENVDSKSLILLPSVSAETFEYLYKYMLNGKVTLPTDQVSIFYQAGKDLKVNGIIDATTTVTIGEIRGDSYSETMTEGVSNFENSSLVEVIPSTSESIVDKSKEMSYTCVYNPYNVEELEKVNVRKKEKQCVSQIPIGKDAWLEQDVLKKCRENSLGNVETFSIHRNESDSDNQNTEESDLKDICTMVTEYATLSQELPDRVNVIRNRLKIRSFSQINKNYKKRNHIFNRKKRTSNLFFKRKKNTLEQAKKNTIKCPKCNMLLKVRSLKWHKLHACKAKNSVENSDKYECMFEDCQFSSSDIKVTQAHSATHKDRFYCNVCQLVFTSDNNRSMHKLFCWGLSESGSKSFHFSNEEMESEVIPISPNE